MAQVMYPKAPQLSLPGTKTPVQSPLPSKEFRSLEHRVQNTVTDVIFFLALWQLTISKQWLSYLKSCLKNWGTQMLTDPSGQLHVPRATHFTVWHGQTHLPISFGDPHQELLGLFKITTVA